jgi:hypothetical protein
MHQQLWGYNIEEKLYLGVREQKSLNTTAQRDTDGSHSGIYTMVYQDMTLYRFINMYCVFEETCYLHLKASWESLPNDTASHSIRR